MPGYKLPPPRSELKWSDIRGYEGLYLVSDQGDVVSLGRVVVDSLGKSRPVHAKLLKNTLMATGYSKVTLVSLEGVKKPRKVHHLVMESFVGDRGSLDVRHLNGVRTDNRLENLKYGTRSENNLDAVRHGTHYHASRVLCKRGHLHADWNNVPSIAKTGRRECLACSRASGWAWHRGLSWSDQLVVDKSHELYKGISDGNI